MEPPNQPLRPEDGGGVSLEEAHAKFQVELAEMQALKATGEAMLALRNSGVLLVDEIRAIQGFSPLPERRGEILAEPFNLAKS